MSNIIATDVQSQEINSGLIELFQITLPNGTTLYLHPGLNDSLDEIKFRDKKAPYTVREYLPMPMLIDGLEVSADGAPSRPTLTIANIGVLFTSQLGNFKHDDHHNDKQ